LIVITKTYDLILWSCKDTSRFRRNHRFVLGKWIEGNHQPGNVRSAMHQKWVSRLDHSLQEHLVGRGRRSGTLVQERHERSRRVGLVSAVGSAAFVRVPLDRPAPSFSKEKSP